MSDPLGSTRPADDQQQAPVDPAQQETERSVSPPTTVPEFPPVGPAGEASTKSGERAGEPPTEIYADGSTQPHAAIESDPSGFAAIIGRFRYEKMLGQGSFGVVIRAWDPELEARRAIKIPHHTLVQTGRVDPESYIAEARKVALLGKHPGIVAVLDVQRTDEGIPYVVSEYVPGGNLSTAMKKGQLPWQRSAEIMATVADAIAHAHSKGVIHRDLKPANILLDRSGKPLVADFGLAMDDGDFAYNTTVCGTYQYMSPQQVDGQADMVDGRADIYSMGVILYEMLAGRSPYRSRDVSSLRREIKQGQPPPIRQYEPQVPEPLAAVCRRAMQKRPDDRFQTASDFAAALRNVLADPEQSAASQTIPAVAASRPRPHWSTAAYLALAALLFAAAAAGVLAIVSGQRSGTVTVDSDGEASPPLQAPVEPVADADPELEIHVQKAGERGTFRGLVTRADLPLGVGDKLQFHVALAEPRFVYVYWIDFRGKVTRYWPPEAMEWDDQQPVDQLTSPPHAGLAADSQWWEVVEAGGPEVILVGVATDKLTKEQTARLEASTPTLARLMPAGETLVEFEFPEHPQRYARIDGAMQLTRGGSTRPIISPKTAPTDHTQLSRLFTAYHGWIVATE